MRALVVVGGTVAAALLVMPDSVILTLIGIGVCALVWMAALQALGRGLARTILGEKGARQ